MTNGPETVSPQNGIRNLGDMLLISDIVMRELGRTFSDERRSPEATT
jgi:hypothetical protein